MKQFLRVKLAKFSSYTEIFISTILLAATVIYSFSMFFEIKDIIINFGTVTQSGAFDALLKLGIDLIIVAEFVKMIAKHTPGSTIEIMLICIAKRVVVEHLDMKDILLGVVAVAVLFAIRKYLYITAREGSTHGATFFGGDMTVKEFNMISDHKIDDSFGGTLADIVRNELTHQKREIALGASVRIGNINLAIQEMEENKITQVEVFYTK